MHQALDSIGVFFDHLAAVDKRAIGVAVCLHLVRGLAVSRAWRNVIAEAYPEEKVRWRFVYGSYLAGVGVNALIPARAGDAVRLYLVKSKIPSATYTTLAASLAVMAIFDTVAALSLFGFALTQNVLPSLDVVPDLPSFDFGWLFQRPRLLAGDLDHARDRDRHRRGLGDRPRPRLQGARRPGLHRRPPAEALSAARRALADRRLDVPHRDDVLVPARLPRRRHRAERVRRPGRPEPLHAAADQPGRHRHRAGAARRRARRRGVAQRAARP